MKRKDNKTGYAYISPKYSKVQYRVGSRFFTSLATAKAYARSKNAKRIAKITYD